MIHIEHINGLELGDSPCYRGARRGRPKKERPQRGDPVTPGMSARDIAVALGMSRRFIATCLDFAAIPPEEFEATVEGDDFSFTELRKLARSRANKSLWYERTCPHCGGLVRIEAVT